MNIRVPTYIPRSLFQRSLDETHGVADVVGQRRTIELCRILWDFYAMYPATLGIR